MLALLLIMLAAPAQQAEPGYPPYEEATDRLTAAYGAAMANLPADAKVSLRNDERRWIEVRNSTCGFETKNRCAVQRTNQRVAELEALLGGTAEFRRMPDPQLFSLERKMEDACKSSGQDADGPICARRDAVVLQLEKRGWCWGPDSAEAEYQRRWMRQGPSCKPYRGG